MELLVFFGICFVGTVLPIIPPEAAAVLGTKQYGWNFLTVGFVGATAQTSAYVIFYFIGEQLIRRWKRLARMVEKTRTRFQAHLERRYLVMTGIGAFVGIPPATALAVLAPGFRIPARHMLPVMFVGRVARFVTLATVGGSLTDLMRWAGFSGGG